MAFSEGLELPIEAGVRTILHPEGTKRDQNTVDPCGQRGVMCLTTGLRYLRF